MGVDIVYPNGDKEYTHISVYRERVSLRDPSLRRARVKLEGKEFWQWPT